MAKKIVRLPRESVLPGSDVYSLETPLDISGTVTIQSPLPITDNAGSLTVDGAVNVNNFPATQPVSGTVDVNNFPATQTVSGSVTIQSPLPVTDNAGSLTVDGTVAVNNFPATQTVSGSVGILQSGGLNRVILLGGTAVIGTVSLDDSQAANVVRIGGSSFKATLDWTGAITGSTVYTFSANNIRQISNIFINASAACIVTLFLGTDTAANRIFKGSLAALATVIIPFTVPLGVAAGAVIKLTTSATGGFCTVIGYELNLL